MATLVAGRFVPSPGALSWHPEGESVRLGWQSHGGAGRLHPARAFPMRLVVEVPDGAARVSAVVMRGVFAACAAIRHEPMGAIGAVLVVRGGEGVAPFQLNLVNGRHYGDAGDGVSVERINGDGTSLRRVGVVEGSDGEVFRVDELRIEFGRVRSVSGLEFRDMGTPASFVLFEVLFEAEMGAVCPFRGHGEKISLAEVGSIVRLRDWGRFDAAVAQLRRGILESGDLDEGKGSALTFLAVVAAAILDFGGDREMHRFQLDAARELDALNDPRQVADRAAALADQLLEGYLPNRKSDSGKVIDRAIRFIESRFTQELDDDDVASEIGLSTSHFRALFRERVGVPFHKYILNMRLEKARQEILTTELAIREISEGMGFVSSAHFSRAFSQRFGVSPKVMRENSNSDANTG